MSRRLVHIRRPGGGGGAGSGPPGQGTMIPPVLVDRLMTTDGTQITTVAGERIIVPMDGA